MKVYCNQCTDYHEQTTAQCGVWSAPVCGTSYRIPIPEYILYKAMPCGHLGMLINNKWVCQTCLSWKLNKQE